MKRIICLIIVLCIVFSSFSFCFAQDWSATDSQNLSNAAYRLQTIITTLTTTNSTLNTISNRVLDIKNALFDENHSVAYWTSVIASYISPIYNALTAVPTDLGVIQGLLGYPTNDGGGTTWHPYIKELKNGDTETSLTIYPLTLDANQNIIFGTPYNVLNTQTADTLHSYFLEWAIAHWNNRFQYYNERILQGETATQNAVNWGNLGNLSFTPLSMTDGLYKWLSYIQAPVARLSYVLASDERIEAQEAAAANEEAVVDNFIDSTGDGSASPSDIGSISDLSAGYKSNFGSDASVSGIFNIFNSNNMGWFSQETANQLDTTTPTRRGSSFDTPLLDQQIEGIYNQIGVKHD